MPAGIVDQAIEPAMARDHFLDQTIYLFDPGNIASDKLRFSGTTRIDFHCQTFAIRLASCTKDDLRSGGNEGPHAAFADSMTASGNDDDFVRVGHIVLAPRHMIRNANESGDVLIQFSLRDLCERRGSAENFKSGHHYESKSVDSRGNNK